MFSSLLLLYKHNGILYLFHFWWLSYNFLISYNILSVKMFHLIHTESFYLKTTIVVSAYLKLLVVWLCLSVTARISCLAEWQRWQWLCEVSSSCSSSQRENFSKFFETVFVKHDYCRFLHLLYLIKKILVCLLLSWYWILSSAFLPSTGMII